MILLDMHPLGYFGIMVILLTVFWCLRSFNKILASIMDEVIVVKDLLSESKKVSRLSTAAENVIFFSDSDYVLKNPWSKYFSDKLSRVVANSMSYKVAASLTGVSLVFTFLLLGFAVQDISKAISTTQNQKQTSNSASPEDVAGPEDAKNTKAQPSPDDNQSNNALGDAFRNMESKFFVSMMGLLGTLGLTLWFNHRRASMSVEITNLFLQVTDQNQLENSYKFRFYHQSATQFKYLQKLDNLEVNLTQLSGELLSKISSSFSEAIGLKIVEIVDQQRTSLGKIETALVSAVRDAMAENTRDVTKALGESIQKIADKLDTKSVNGLDSIVDKIENMVSGGTKNHSQAMGNAIETFSTSIVGMQGMIRDLSASLQGIASTAEAQSTNQMRFVENEIPKVFGHLESVVSRMDSQNQRTLEALQTLLSDSQNNSNNAFVNMTASLQQSELKLGEARSKAASEINEVSMRASESLARSIEQITEKLSEATLRLTEDIATKNRLMSSQTELQMDKVADQAQRLFESYQQIQTTQDITIGRISDTASKLAVSTSEVQRIQNNISGTLSDFKVLNEVVEATASNLKQLPIIVSSTSSSVNDLLVRQEANIQSINTALEVKSRAWDATTDLFTRKYQTASTQLEQTYSNLVQQFVRATDLSSNISELSDSVSELKESIDKRSI